MEPEGHGPTFNGQEQLLAQLTVLQEEMHMQPYSIQTRVKLAKAYQTLGYPDLAAGDAYKALTLIDEATDDGEYGTEVLNAARRDYQSVINSAQPDTVKDLNQDDQTLTEWVKSRFSSDIYDILIISLLSCGCLRSASNFISRASKTTAEDGTNERYQTSLREKLQSYFKSRGEDFNDQRVEDYPDKGQARREKYPWNRFEPDRCSEESVLYLNEQLATVAPKLEVRVTNLPLLTTQSSNPEPLVDRFVLQLGVFAKEDISPGEKILEEKSLLTAISRLHDSYCDACSVKLPNSQDDVAANEPGHTVVSCEECDEVFFCSMECHDLAQEHYHPALCGVPQEQKTVPAKEAADFLYTLLLIRALALANTRGVHPLELEELRFIWGDYHVPNTEETWTPVKDRDPFDNMPRNLPFSFEANVLTPLHMLEKMDVNIYAGDDRYETWVFNTLYAKFRGTASAQQGLDGRPEIGAVHPIWCLANHSCDPNVAWEWQGSMRFWTRESLVDWDDRSLARKPGLRKDEEVLSHYCDINLPVKERREWAVGALGGDCVCARCVWEAAEEAT